MQRSKGERRVASSRRPVTVRLLCFLALTSGSVRAQSDALIPGPALVSRTVAGNAANQPSTEPAISLDGGFVVFTTMASDIFRADQDRVLDVLRQR